MLNVRKKDFDQRFNPKRCTFNQFKVYRVSFYFYQGK